MAVLNPPGYLHNLSTHTAQVDRIAAIAAGMVPDGAGLTWRPGCRGAGDLKVAAQGSPNMTVAVAAGLALVKGTTNTFQGLYSVPNDGSVNVTITAAHATLPRNDLIVARVQDAFYAGASNTATIEVVTGTAAASPADPTVPASCLVLARVRVLAAATSIVNGQIDDLRTFTSALGGTVPCLSTARPPHMEGLSIYETDTDKMYVSDGTNWSKFWEAGWNNFVCTLGGWTISNGTMVARYTQTGKYVRVHVEYTVGSSDTKSGAPTFSLPVAPAASITAGAALGTMGLQDTSAGARAFRFCLFSTASGGTIAGVAQDDTRLSPTSPWTWATGDQFLLDYSYEAA